MYKSVTLGKINRTQFRSDGKCCADDMFGARQTIKIEEKNS